MEHGAYKHSGEASKAVLNVYKYETCFVNKEWKVEKKGIRTCTTP